MKIVALFLICICSGCVTLESRPPASLQHVVLFWLKEPGNAEHRHQIIASAQTFRDIPGVLDVRAGTVVESDRDIVDDSYDVGLIVVVPDRERLKEYIAHPIHQEAKQQVLMPLVKKVLVYDFVE